MGAWREGVTGKEGEGRVETRMGDREIGVERMGRRGKWGTKRVGWVGIGRLCDWEMGEGRAVKTRGRGVHRESMEQGVGRLGRGVTGRAQLPQPVGKLV